MTAKYSPVLFIFKRMQNFLSDNGYIKHFVRDKNVAYFSNGGGREVPPQTLRKVGKIKIMRKSKICYLCLNVEKKLTSIIVYQKRSSNLIRYHRLNCHKEKFG